MSARDCQYCERDDCDTDCSFADRHNGTERNTAKQWREIGAEQLRDALREALNAWQGWVEDRHVDEPDHPEMARIAELRKLCGP